MEQYQEMNVEEWCDIKGGYFWTLGISTMSIPKCPKMGKVSMMMIKASNSM